MIKKESGEVTSPSGVTYGVVLDEKGWAWYLDQDKVPTRIGVDDTVKCDSIESAKSLAVIMLTGMGLWV